jgi:hypothetical protein
MVGMLRPYEIPQVANRVVGGVWNPLPARHRVVGAELSVVRHYRGALKQFERLPAGVAEW